MDKRFVFGCVITLSWIGFMALMLTVGQHPGKLNEWGDFFAGFFAPIAFLWLVLGYLQQGEELRNTARALVLQADELRNSVEQQRQLVEVSRLQITQEMEALKEESERRRESARPRLIVSPGGWSSTASGLTTYDAVIHRVRWRRK